MNFPLHKGQKQAVKKKGRSQKVIVKPIAAVSDADEDDANEAKKADHSKPPTGKKVTRDPKAPKQPSNDVIKFPLEEIRSTVVAENPEMKPLDVTAEAEKRWRELREKQKQP